MTTQAPAVTPMLPGASEPPAAGEDGEISRDPAEVLADVEVTGITGDTPFQQQAIEVLRTYAAEFALAQATNDTSRAELAAILEPEILSNLMASVAQQAADGQYIRGTERIIVISATELSNGVDLILEVCFDNQDRNSYLVETDELTGEGAPAEDAQVLVTRLSGQTRISSIVAGQPGLCQGVGL